MAGTEWGQALNLRKHMSSEICPPLWRMHKTPGPVGVSSDKTPLLFEQQLAPLEEQNSAKNAKA